MYCYGSPPHSNVNTKTEGSTISVRNGKRTKRSAWGARERAGMSFLIVVAFFAVFGLIILTEVKYMCMKHFFFFIKNNYIHFIGAYAG